MPELPEWRAFCATARLQSISRAAEFLGIGIPTATKHIAKLEQRLGVQLFDRTKRPIELTPAGQRYASLASPLVEAFDSMVVNASADDSESPVTITGPSGTISYKLPAVVKRYQEIFPRTQVRMYARPNAEAIRLLFDGVADIALVNPEVPAAIEYHPLMSYKRVLIAPPGHPLAQHYEVTIDELAQHRLILLRAGTNARTILESEFKRQEIPYHLALEVDNMDILKRYVMFGLGVSPVPDFMVEPEDRERMAVVPIRGEVATEQLGAATLREKPLTTAASNFLTVLRRTMTP